MDDNLRLMLRGFALGVVFTLSIFSALGTGKISDGDVVDVKDCPEPTQCSSTSTKTADRHRSKEFYEREVQSFWPPGRPEESHLCTEMVPKPTFVNRTLTIIRAGVEILGDDNQLAYLKHLSERFSSNDLRILIDVTLNYALPLDDEERNAIRAEIERKTNISTMVYTVFDILDRFPSTKWPLVMDPEVWKTIEDEKERKGVALWVGGMLDRFAVQGTKLFSHLMTNGYKAFLNFLIHEPSFVWAYENECEASQKAYKAMWVLESDVVFTGNERLFFNFYETIDADLVSVFEPFHSFVKKFFAWNVTGERFPSWPLHKWEHVERYSSSMLRFLDGAMRRNYTAHGEYLSSTLCAMVEQCATADLRDHNFVNRNLYGFQSSRGISGKLFSAIHHCRSIEKPDCREVRENDVDSTPLKRLVTNVSANTEATICRCCGPDWHNKWLHSLKDVQSYLKAETTVKLEDIRECEQDAFNLLILA